MATREERKRARDERQDADWTRFQRTVRARRRSEARDALWARNSSDLARLGAQYQRAGIHWDSLPQELVDRIVSYLPVSDMARLERTSRDNVGRLAAARRSSGLEALREAIMWCTSHYGLEADVNVTVQVAGMPSPVVLSFSYYMGSMRVQGIVPPADHRVRTYKGGQHVDGVTLNLSREGSCSLTHESGQDVRVTRLSITAERRDDEVFELVVQRATENDAAARATLRSNIYDEPGSAMSESVVRVVRGGVLGPFLRMVRMVMGKLPQNVLELEERRRSDPVDVPPTAMTGSSSEGGYLIVWA